MTTSGIILAAGNGKRFGAKKQFEKFLDKEVWQWSFDTACQVLDEVVVVGVHIKGGKTRQKSVLEGLKWASGDNVVIFDAARPLVTTEQIGRIVTEVEKYPSVSFGMKPADTLYKDGLYFREHWTALQVPQAFNREMLIEAHKKTKLKNTTDDTKIFYDVHNILPKIIEGGRNLMKITVKEDLDILKTL